MARCEAGSPGLTGTPDTSGQAKGLKAQGGFVEQVLFKAGQPFSPEALLRERAIPSSEETGHELCSRYEAV